MKFIIDKTERRLKNITYQTDHNLYATYKGYDIQVAEQETGGFYATVKDPKGKKIIDNHVGGLYLNEAVKDVMITICFKISRESAKRLNEAQTKQCNIPHVSGSLQAEAVEFAEWIRTFDSLEKKQGFWIIESQISSEDLYKGFLKDRERWRNDR